MSPRFILCLGAALCFSSSVRAATVFTSQRPAPGDNSANSRSVELGMSFRSDVPGEITGLRFYKSATSTGSQAGHLWTSTGGLLGSLNFVAQSTAGWQTASFGAPVAIKAGTTYVASFHTESNYSVTRMAFASSGIDAPPLHALRDGVDGFNGAYAYGSGAVFPRQGTRSSNYWIDVLFTPAGPDASPPTAAVSSPAGGASVGGTIVVSASAADDVAVTTVQFKLDGAPLGPPDLEAPFTAGWNTGQSAEGPHELSVAAWDAAGNAAASAAILVVVDNAAPIVSLVSISSVGRSSATVSWLASEPVTTRVEYGTSAIYGTSTALAPSAATGGVVILRGLSAGTLYHYRIRSFDAAGNSGASGDAVFTTAASGGPAPRTVVSLTFDDGTSSQFLARDILNARGVKGTFYINSGRVGAAGFMSLAQLRSIAADGHEIGGHTAGHFDVTTLTAAQLEQQVCGDRAALVSMGFDPVSLAYPFGAYNSAAEAMAAGCGYRNARAVGGLGCSGCPGSAPLPPPDRFAVPTPDSVKNTTTLDGMRQMVVDAEEAGGGWVPIVMHLVCEGCDVMAVSSGTLASFVDWVQSREAAGTVIMTMGEVLVDRSSPTATISSPSAGAAVRGTIAVSAAASDDVGVAAVQFRLDGADLGPRDAAAPYEAAWDTAASSAGPHALSAVAWDAAGNASTSAAVAVMADNAPPVIGSVSVASVGESSATVAWLTGEPANALVEYGPTPAYGSATALDPAFAASHERVLSGLSAATLYRFRARSADAAGNASVSAEGTFTTAPRTLAACLSSAGAWANEPFAPQASSFTFAFDAVAGAPGLEGSIGLSNGSAAGLEGLAAAVRFNRQGFIDVRYSTSYARMTPIAYSTGTVYHFEMRVSVSGRLFDVHVSSAGGVRHLLARSYPFRSSQGFVTALDNFAVLASTGGLTACNPAVSAPAAPWWDGIREVYASAAGGKAWYSSWDNGLSRAFGRAVDPLDPWFDAAHGTGSYLVDADSGVFKISGSMPRLYIHHPQLSVGSSSSTAPGSHAKQWHDVEMTVYGMRVADSGVAYAGIAGFARSNHGTTGSEASQLCDSRGLASRFRYNGRLDLLKETSHPAAYAVNTTTTALWPSGLSMPSNVWIGFKFVVYDRPDGNVKVEAYMDMTDGAGGGTWVLVNQFEDNGTNWGGGLPCASGVDPRERLTNGSDRPGTESGLPNVSVYFQADGIGVDGLLYKKMSVREITAASAGAAPLAAAGAAPEPGAVAPAAAEDFQFRDLYAFPNPSRRGERVTIRFQAGVAEQVDVGIFDLSGRRVGGGSASGPVFIDDGNGKGPQFTYDYHWDVAGAAAAVYRYAVTARRQGRAIGRTGKVALIK